MKGEIKASLIAFLKARLEGESEEETEERGEEARVFEVHHYHPTEHSHYEYALRGHSHDERYSSLNHTHTEYAERQHSHNEYSRLGHNHDERYAFKDHTHKGYAKEKHYHEEYAKKYHRHSLADVNGGEELREQYQELLNVFLSLQDRLIDAEDTLSFLNGGEPGQVLTRTRTGYAWRYLPPTEIRYIGGGGGEVPITTVNPILWGSTEDTILWGSTEDDYIQWG
jgi:hypothetical protein